MRILFMGSGEIAEPTLERLLASPADEVVAVVTQPDRPKGRKLKVAPCAIKAFAEARDVPVLAPEKVGQEGSVEEIQALAPDLIVVAAYGQYIKPAILAIPPNETINLHPSLLPKYRGAAPIQMAIAEGETETGVSIMYMAKDMDAGDVILQRIYPIDPDDTAATLMPKLALVGADMVMEAIDLIRAGNAPRVPQDHDRANYVPRLTKADGKIDWSLPAAILRNRLRGFTPWPGCFCELDSGEALKVWAVMVEPGEGEPGVVLSCDGDGPLIATGEQALRLLEVQPAGKKRMSGAACLNGRALSPGDRMK